MEPEMKELPCFSTNIEAAWIIVEKLKSMGMMVSIQTSNDFNSVEVEKFEPSESGGGRWVQVVEPTEGESVPHAICLASLKAVNFETGPKAF